MKRHLLRYIIYSFQILITTIITLCPLQGIAFPGVRLQVKSVVGTPGTENNDVLIKLDNKNDNVSLIQFEICDVDNYLLLENVLTTSRTKAFDAIQFKELANGCARVMVSSKEKNIIEKGKGPVLILKYAVSSKAPLTEHRKIIFGNISVRNSAGTSLDVTPISGAFIFIISQGSIEKVYPKRITGNRKKSTIHPLLVIGEDTRFNLSSRLNFNPRDEIECIWEAGFGNYLFAIIELPAAPPLGFADIDIFTDGGKVLVNGSDVFEVVSQ